MYDLEPFSLQTLNLLSRWYKLRKLGYLYPLLQNWQKLYKFDPVGRWEVREEVSLDELREDVERVEELLIVNRKPMDSERGMSGTENRKVR